MALLLSALNSESHGPGLNLGKDHCVVFLGKTLCFLSASLHPGDKWVQCTSKFNAGGNPAMD